MIRRLLPALLLSIVTLVVFGQVMGFGFLSYDDGREILQNPYLNPPSWSGIAQAWSEWRAPYFSFYLPVTDTVWGLTLMLAQACGTLVVDAARWLHGLSLFTHLLAALVLARWLRLMTGSYIGAWCGALLFAIHPLQVESVAWIAAYDTPLSVLFMVLALERQASHFKAPKSLHPTHKRWWWVAPLIWGTLATLARPPAMAVFPLLMVMQWFGFKRSVWSSAAWLVAAAAIGLPILMIATNAQSENPMTVAWYLRPLVAGDAWWFYFRKIFQPMPLGPDYGLTPLVALKDPWVAVTGSLPWVVIALAILGRHRLIGLSLLVFTVLLLPSLGLMPFLFQNTSTVADRYGYPAMIGVALVFAGQANHIRRHNYLMAMAVLVILAMIFSHRQTHLWRDTESLFMANIRWNTTGRLVHENLGGIASEKSSRGDPAGAIALWRQLLNDRPNHCGHLNNLGATLWEQKQAENAVEVLMRASLCDGSDGSGPEIESTFNLALALNDIGRFRDAALTAERAIDRGTRRQFDAHLIAASGWYRSGELERALTHATSADHMRSTPVTQEALRSIREAQSNQQGTTP